MSDVYRRAGRGGAGNYYSKKDIEDVDKRVREQQDVESQKPIPEDPMPTDPADPPAAPMGFSLAQQQHHQQPPVSAYARSGRGGAGNFVDPVQQAAADISGPAGVGSSSSDSGAGAQTTTTASSASSSAPTARHIGRGGAGNYAASTETRQGVAVVDEEQERKRKAALDSGILKDIQESLPQPPRTYRMHGGEAGKGREKAKGPDM